MNSKTDKIITPQFIAFCMADIGSSTGDEAIFTNVPLRLPFRQKDRAKNGGGVILPNGDVRVQDIADSDVIAVLMAYDTPRFKREYKIVKTGDRTVDIYPV